LRTIREKEMSTSDKIFDYNLIMMSSLFFPNNENEFIDAITEHDALPSNNTFNLDNGATHEW
jgi:hypothetical protein